MASSHQILHNDIGDLPEWAHKTKIDMHTCQDPSRFSVLIGKLNSRISTTIEMTSRAGAILETMRRNRKRNRDALKKESFIGNEKHA